MIIKDRIENISNVSIKSGSHKANNGTDACVMELVSWVAGEPWSDAPQCACPVITAFLVSWNDSLPTNAERDRLLKPLIPLIIGTRSTKAVEERRSYMALDWMIRVYTPKWLDMVPALHEQTKALRELDAIADMAGAAAAGLKVKIAQKDSAAAWAAARAAARAAAVDAAVDAERAAAVDAAGAAAGAAAWAAARAAAWAAARDAAVDAARAAAVDAAVDAAWDAARAAAVDAARAAAVDAAWAAARAAAVDAARAAAWDAAWAALKPTTEWLQASALNLAHEMIAAQASVEV